MSWCSVPASSTRHLPTLVYRGAEYQCIQPTSDTQLHGVSGELSAESRPVGERPSHAQFIPPPQRPSDVSNAWATAIYWGSTDTDVGSVSMACTVGHGCCTAQAALIMYKGLSTYTQNTARQGVCFALHITCSSTSLSRRFITFHCSLSLLHTYYLFNVAVKH